MLGFELRASHLLGKCTTTWLMPPACFCLVLFCFVFCFSYFSDRVLCFCLWSDLRPWSSYLHFLLSWRDRHSPLCLALWLRWGSVTFYLGWPQTKVLLISASGVAVHSHTRPMYMNGPIIIIHSKKKMKTSQMSIIWWMNKQNVIRLREQYSIIKWMKY
jgi:hypothetical protein